ncbi:MAG: AI-2E family transporter [Deltaproteobacteria bacterium]|jgi:predicted PurR-regulated permease PerM|nr:AI-2E family transporter [Deltaproteobacteria bacterium]
MSPETKEQKAKEPEAKEKEAESPRPREPLFEAAASKEAGALKIYKEESSRKEAAAPEPSSKEAGAAEPPPGSDRGAPHEADAAPAALPGQLGQLLVLGLAGVFLIAILLIELKVVLLPMVLAFLVCCVLNPLVEIFKKWGLPRFAAIILTLAVGFGLIWLIMNYVLASLTSFKDGFPRYAENIKELGDYLTRLISGRFDFTTVGLVRDQLSKLSFGGSISMLMDYVMSFTGHLTLTALLTFYFLPALPTLPDKLRGAFPGRRGETIGGAVLTVIGQVQRYVLAKTLLSLGLGLAVTIACYAFKVDFAGTWGIFAFFLNFIPNLGVVVATVPPFLICIVQYGPGAGLKLLIALAAVQIVSGNLVEPKVLGRSVNLSPTATLLAILVWGWIWGPIGMILAVPLMAVVKLTCQNFPALRPLASLMGR